MPQETPTRTLEQNLLIVLRRHSRLAVLLVLAGGLAGAWLCGWPLSTYRSTGLVRVSPAAPRVLYTNEQNATLPLFDSFIESQVALMQSQKLVEDAVKSAEWQNVCAGVSDEAVGRFANSLKALRMPQSEIIRVSFTDSDPNVAVAGVGAALNAYVKAFDEQNNSSVQSRLALLRERETKLDENLKKLRNQALSIAREFGADDLTPLYQFKLQELQKLETALKEAEQLLGPAAASSELQPDGKAARWLAMYEFAAADPVMRAYVMERSNLQRELERVSIRLGDNHPRRQELAASLQAVERSMQQYAEQFEKSSGMVIANRFWHRDGAAPWVSTAAHLAQRCRQLREQHAQAQTQTLAIGRSNLEIAALRTEADSVHQKLEETQQRIEQLNLETTQQGRVSIVSLGNRPVSPFWQTRAASMVLGGALGSGIGLSLLMLFGLADRRLRSVADLRNSTGKLPVLGIIPNILPRGNARALAAAAKSIYQLRARLLISQQQEERRVFTITGCSGAAGKTSLTAALGASLASANSRTLLVDCDLAGRGLTTQMAAMMHQAPDSAAPGLLDALAGADLNSCLVATGLPGLFILPLGTVTTAHVGNLSLTGLREILHRARLSFDTILVDTGPISMSPEASLAAEESDGVLLVVADGNDRAQVEKSMEDLQTIRARTLGVVYNRAGARDMRPYGRRATDLAYSSRSCTDAAPVAVAEIAAGNWASLHPHTALVATGIFINKAAA